jgi:hypothetical protein
MATTMQTAESSVEVQMPPEQAHKKWLEWTGEGGPGMPQAGAQEVDTSKMDPELKKSEKGMAYFEPGSGGATRLRMQLRFNPDVVKKEGLDEDWVSRRINLYLSRFKNFAEGRAA